MVRSSTLLLLVLVGCTASHTVDTGFDYDPLPRSSALTGCEEQLEESENGLPEDLECTGLYADFDRKEINENLESFTPAYKLWSDGSEKDRWIELPEGEVIDTSDMRNWKFPVGTKLWKEFRANGQRAETRLFMKVRDDSLVNNWVKTTYVWRGDKAAKRNDNGGTTNVNGANYEFPSVRDCNSCHEGSPDSVLGFEAVSLGLPQADQDGVTLAKLMERGVLSDPPERTSFEIGDDGTGLAADALGWLHINCGVTCHNDGINSNAEETDLRMKLDPAQLDGRPATEFQMYQQLVDQPAETVQWVGQKRVVPGNADESLLFQLMTTRLGVDGNRQMPPLLTRVVPEEDAARVRAWIEALEPVEPSEETGPE